MIDLSCLNDVQIEAVTYNDGPSLIIAGAGSGKTRVLTYKIACLIDGGVPPETIMALTFTNKAAKEMKDRIASITGSFRARRMHMGTFHSVFARILRDNSELLGFPRQFTIYDTQDSKNMIKTCIRELQLDEKQYRPSDVLSRISAAKNNLVTAASYLANSEAIANDTTARRPRICDIYKLYASKCKAEGVMDFDDILLYMNILLRDFPDVCGKLGDMLSYMLVDEYQDTNLAQYKIIRRLSMKNRNVTVVGDDSQSIYAFRGARIQNILNFKRDFPEAREFRLERNYRSTKIIVHAANSVIAHNSNRLKKECFSEGDTGEKIEVLSSFNDQQEAQAVVSSILSRIYSTKAPYRSFAVLYRTNSQSRLIEEYLRKANLPYKVYAGHSFYERKEIKDMLAYYRLVLNHSDNEAFKRVVNFPARGIGDTTLKALSEYAASCGLPLWDAVISHGIEEGAVRPAALQKLRSFVSMVSSFASRADDTDAYTLANEIAVASGVMNSLAVENTVEARTRLENINELLAGVNEYVSQRMEEWDGQDDGGGGPVTLGSYMENVSLLTDEDKTDDDGNDDKVRLMTVHASKGLEFPYVYIVGMEENLFPGPMSLSSPDQTEEERRLFYVALTRAEKAVSVSFAKSRFLRGQIVICSPSRFLYEIDPSCLAGTLPVRAGMGMQASPVTRLRPAEPAAGAGCTVTFDIAAGDRVEHGRFGKGTVLLLDGTGTDKKAKVRFDASGEKVLLLKYAKLVKLQ
ncbi:MAG TPA: UvrD-helicase domain-containing protein [Candidatus Coprenecus stercoripullorum]|nr:UvrD-helicase domain-containing protein [Candidatus Coprenecus stercoripullorum]